MLGPLGPVGLQRSGKGSRIIFNDVILLQGEWRAGFRGDDLDTTHFESQGFEQGLIGIEVCEFNSTGNWDANNNVIDSPPGIYPQDLAPNIYMYTNVSDNVFWFLPFSRLISTENGSTVRGLVTFNFNGKSNGGFTPPTG